MLFIFQNNTLNVSDLITSSGSASSPTWLVWHKLNVSFVFQSFWGGVIEIYLSPFSFYVHTACHALILLPLFSHNAYSTSLFYIIFCRILRNVENPVGIDHRRSCKAIVAGDKVMKDTSLSILSYIKIKCGCGYDIHNEAHVGSILKGTTM